MSDNKIRLEDLTSRGRVIVDGFLRFGEIVTHPLRSLTLFAAGSQREYLDEAPADKTWHSVLGTLVLLTSAMAGFGAFATAGFVRHGEIVVGRSEIAWGIGWAAVIFVYDRAIVLMQLLPVSFNNHVLAMLWNPSTDIRWYVKAAEGKETSMTLPQWRGLGRLIFASIPRIVIAVATSFVFSETLLYVYFQDDLQSVMIDVANSNQKALQHEADVKFKEAKDQAQAKVTSLERSLDKGTPSIGDLQAKVAQLTIDQKNAESDASVFDQLRIDESVGTKITLTLSDGTSRSTSGQANFIPGSDGVQSGGFLAQKNAKLALAQSLGGKISKTQGIIDRRLENIKRKPKYVAAVNALNSVKEDKIPPFDPLHVKGIGIRRVALARYEHDANPLTPKEDRPKYSCKNWLCASWHAIVPGTPAGPLVGAMRFIFFFIELSPLLTKIAYTLRRRRPYDEVVAREEVITAADTLVELSASLNLNGQTIEEHGRQRRARRGSEAAEYIVARSEVRAGGEFRRPVANWRQWFRRRPAAPPRTSVRRPPVDP